MSKTAILPRKDLFHLPDGLIYLDGNSLGPLPRSASERVAKTVSAEWGDHLITGWNVDGWMEQPSRIGNRIAKLVGASDATVVLGDTLSIKVYQALSSALSMKPDRKVILSDTGNFPTDLYMAQGLVSQLSDGHELKLCEPENVLEAIDENVAVVMLTHVDYRTGRMHDMETITRAAHRAGAVMIWDLAHSAGAVPVNLEAVGCEFAVGCTYKYLNGGPGAPAFIYIRKDLADDVRPALCGWLGHDSPFAFEQSYRPAKAIERMRVGTPPVLQMAALDAALDAWDGVSMDDIRAVSVELCELFINETVRRCPQLQLASPRKSELRGSQVSFAFEEGYAVIQALVARKVIGDFRAPDLMRFGFTPLYIDREDVLKACDILEEIMRDKIWDEEKYKKKQAVT